MFSKGKAAWMVEMRPIIENHLAKLESGATSARSSREVIHGLGDASEEERAEATRVEARLLARIDALKQRLASMKFA
ncbi:hypothetical protein OPT61_g9150 [Boeremia exigua]|uniref:Uncharacterized protein n=1 Tax=Boeremia exigua TaxID=749465 RepID=A0ACC2HVB7_9PLEO|nr:hypothetical protein OPT61_g9150 [Boeremia exigua]